MLVLLLCSLGVGELQMHLRAVMCMEDLALIYAWKNQSGVVGGLILALGEVRALVQPPISLCPPLRFQEETAVLGSLIEAFFEVFGVYVSLALE